METRGTILMVDDTPEIAALLRGILNGAGYRVLVAPTVTVALHILAAFRVGLVITDAFRPGTDPQSDIWADLDRLARSAGDTPLILYTPDAPGRYADHAAHGFVACLTKPLDLAALLALVGSLLPAVGHPAPIDHRPAAREG